MAPRYILVCGVLLDTTPPYNTTVYIPTRCLYFPQFSNDIYEYNREHVIEKNNKSNTRPLFQ